MTEEQLLTCHRIVTCVLKRKHLREETIEDAAQHAMLKLLSLPRDPAIPEKYAVVVALNYVRDLFRYRPPRAALEDAFLRTQAGLRGRAAIACPREERPGEVLAQLPDTDWMDNEALALALDQLPARDQETLRGWAEGLTGPALAAHIGVRPGNTLNSAVQRAKNRLRRAWERAA